ncbi:PPOX class F420-dependent oxidoreductase [Kitasatospora sp. NPDC096147]|uniref:PPOX class F420-dependent oxidoreductase n=1 Tax=Kitasatospora sp. NPDC096147 TaxID=3364093 RepID=UPI003823D921
MTVITNDAIRALLDAPVPAVLATVNPDGGPQTSMVWVGRDGEDLLISSTAGLRKVRNLERDPRASLILHDPSDPLRYVEFRGRAAISEDTDRALAVTLAEQYEGPGAGEEYLELPPEVLRVAIRITPEKVLGSLTKI